ncbi:glycosyltransferase family 2 protein [Mycolicibacterium moriokaense]|uniref:Cellulose synthase (UDP-forming) n=1 Tax=Mycolicibacterium moriokaense TaxID=39691 RepID=A0A318H189_9MYCO|nr:cellulose synthase catalytic subunit [Mycolicibacterium moriokaense]PXW96895.1 cellulose synthase (UDP-forming) [Mycolicibacterium moriokaense]
MTVVEDAEHDTELSPKLVAVQGSRDTLLVTPPSDEEVYGYFGPQMRWVQVLLLVAYVLAAWSLFEFTVSALYVLSPLLVVLALNIVGNLLSALTSFNSRRYNGKSHRRLVQTWQPLGRYPGVDVFLPTYGEGLDVLRNTYTFVAGMQWPGELNVYVLDDGGRESVRDLAADFGFHYILRPNRGYMKKAGNLQYAFTQTRGDQIVILDADFCPRHDFLQHLIPYMDDPGVGIVQSPQYFSTTEDMGWIERTAGATQELFYRWILPSRDRFDAAVCVGTCAIYRRAALEAAGGFAQIEHSEDIHTGLFLMRAGYQTRYVPAIVSRGLCPSDLAGFLNQQYRWCNGSLVRLDNEHLEGEALKMTLRQRICFWAGVLYYITTAINVVALYIPGLVMAAFFPEQVQPIQFVPFLAGLWVYLVVLPFVSQSRWRFEVLRIQMAYSYAHIVAIAHKLRGRSAGWVPTGAVGATNSLARTISRVGAAAIVISLAPFWVMVIYDLETYGLRRFWLMGMFLLLYTYIALPLLVEFAKMLAPAPRAKRAGRRTMEAVESPPRLEAVAS